MKKDNLEEINVIRKYPKNKNGDNLYIYKKRVFSAIIAVAILIILIITLSGCNKDKNKTYELPINNGLVIQSNNSIKGISLFKSIDISGYNVEKIDIYNEIIILSNNNFYYLCNINGVKIIDEAFNGYDYYGNFYALSNNDRAITYNVDKKEVKSYPTSKIKLLKDDYLAVKENGSYEIKIYDEGRNHIFTIFDKKSTLQIKLCDYFLLYINEEFNYFQIYDLNNKDSQPKEIAYIDNTNVEYLGEAKFLIMNKDNSNTVTIAYNDVYDAVNRTLVKLTTEVVYVNNIYCNNDIKISQPYSIVADLENNYYLTDTSLNPIIRIPSYNLILIDNLFSASYQTTEDVITKLYRYDENQRNFGEILNSNATTAAYYNDGIITTREIEGRYIYYGAKNIDGTRLVNAEYTNMSIFVGGKAMAVITEGDENKYYLITKQNSQVDITLMDKKVKGFYSGLFWYEDGTNTKYESFDGTLLFETSQEAKIDKYSMELDYGYFQATEGTTTKLYILKSVV